MRNLHTVFYMTKPFCTLTNSVQGSLFSMCSPTLVIYCLFDNTQSNRCEVIFHCGLICISLMITDVEQFFYMHLWTIHISSLEQCLFRSFAHLKNCIVCFLLFSFMGSSYIWGISPLSDWCANIFSHLVCCLFILLRVSFDVYKLFSLI